MQDYVQLRTLHQQGAKVMVPPYPSDLDSFSRGSFQDINVIAFSHRHTSSETEEWRFEKKD